MSGFDIFDEWFASLTDSQASEVLRSERGSDVAAWMAASLDEHGIVTTNCIHATDPPEVLLTGALEDYLDLLRSESGAAGALRTVATARVQYRSAS